MKRVSIVVPVYNEASGISRFYDGLLMPELKKLGLKYEVIFVNDGSTDDSLDRLTDIAQNNKDVRVINLSRNFGKEIATTAGIHYAAGDAIIMIDADGQHPPAYLNQFIGKWRSGAQVVVGVRNSNQKEGLVKKLGSKVFYALFNSSSGAQLVPRSTDFRLIDSEVQQEFIKFNERNRITRGLIDWLGYERDFVYFDSPARLAGEASYSTRQLVKLALNSFVSLSLKPLIMLATIGVAITLVAFVAGLFILVEQFVLGDPLGLNFTGSALLGIFISFLVGLVMTSQGVMAVYLSHVHTQSQDRPLFVVNKRGSRNL